MTSTTDGIGYDRLPGLMSLMTGDEKHGPAATSTLDVLWVLYDWVLRVSSETADDRARDRFLLSKGHGPMAYYAVLAAKGFVPRDWLPDFGSYDSPLGHHPDRTLVPGVEIGSGSLGHGLPLAVGSALGLRALGSEGSGVWVLVGDAEMEEGSNHEAVAYAGAVVREERGPVVLAVGPLLDAVRDAVAGLDATVLYASTVRPFDSATLRAAVRRSDAAEVVLVEPYLAGTSAAFVNEALADLPHRVLSLGTARAELRRYGSWREHVTAHGLDASGLRARIAAFA